MASKVWNPFFNVTAPLTYTLKKHLGLGWTFHEIGLTTGLFGTRKVIYENWLKVLNQDKGES